MTRSKSHLTIEDHGNDYTYRKNKTGLDIQFNRVALYFFHFLYNLYNLLYSSNQTWYTLHKS